MRKFILVAAATAAVALVGAAATSVVARAAKAERCDGCLVVLDSAGSILESRGVKKAESFGGGTYKVTFKSSLFGCAVLATGYGADAYAAFSIDAFNGKIGYFYTSRRNGSGIVSPSPATFNAAVICV